VDYKSIAILYGIVNNEWHSSNSQPTPNVYITDVNGKIIRDIEKVSVKFGNNAIQVSRLTFSEGMYFCHFEMDEVHLVKKILIRK